MKLFQTVIQEGFALPVALLNALQLITVLSFSLCRGYLSNKKATDADVLLEGLR